MEGRGDRQPRTSWGGAARRARRPEVGEQQAFRRRCRDQPREGLRSARPRSPPTYVQSRPCRVLQLDAACRRAPKGEGSGPSQLQTDPGPAPWTLHADEPWSCPPGRLLCSACRPAASKGPPRKPAPPKLGGGQPGGARGDVVTKVNGGRVWVGGRARQMSPTPGHPTARSCVQGGRGQALRRAGTGPRTSAARPAGRPAQHHPWPGRPLLRAGSLILLLLYATYCLSLRQLVMF